MEGTRYVCKNACFVSAQTPKLSAYLRGSEDEPRIQCLLDSNAIAEVAIFHKHGQVTDTPCECMSSTNMFKCK